MFDFILFAMVIVYLHSNENVIKTKVSTRSGVGSLHSRSVYMYLPGVGIIVIFYHSRSI